MNEEFSKTLQEDMLKQFTAAKKDLEEKISTLEEVLSKGELSEERLTDFSNTIDKMKEVAQLIDNIINAIQDKEADFNQTEFLQDTKYENSWIKNSDRLTDIDEKMKSLESAKQKLSEASSDKLKKYSDIGKERLDKKIALLKKKQGIIQERQRKILNKRVADILKQKLSKFEDTSILAEKITKNNKLAGDNTRRQSETDSKLDEIGEMREALMSSGNILNKFTAAKLWFVEKLTIGKIKTLQGKQGILVIREKSLIERNVDKSWISKMKNNVKNLFHNISETVAPYMMPSKEWQEEHVHKPKTPPVEITPENKSADENKKIDVVKVLDEIYKVDEMGNIIEFLGKENELDTTNFHYIDEELEARNHTR